MSTLPLITIGEPAHTAHDAEHVIVRRIHEHGRGREGAHRVVGHRQEERRVIDTGQVARA